MRSLRLKILALAAFLVVLTQAGTVATVLVTANRDVDQRVRAKLKSTATVSGMMLPQRAIALQKAMRFLTEDRHFLAALAGGDLTTVRSELGASRAKASADIAFLMDDGGTVVAAGETLAEGRTAFPDLTRTARAAGVARDAVTLNGVLYEMVTIPVAAGGTHRWLAMGNAYDDHRAKLVRQISDMDAAFVTIQGGEVRVLGSSLTASEQRSLAMSRSAGLPQPGQIMPVTLGDRQYLAMGQNIASLGTHAEMVLFESLDSALAPYRTMRLWVMALGAFALLVAVAGAAVVARALTRPVGELVHAARRIREGDYDTTVRVQADGELTELADAFNTMQQGIAEREQRISYHARFDALTGLPNRLQAAEQLAEAVQRCRTAGTPLAALVVGLGDFHNIAATLGHEISDALLCQAVERLRAGVDARHVVARLDGDEFLVVLEDAFLDRAQAVAEDILRTLGVGLSFREVNMSVDGVVGIALYPEHSTDPEQLLLRAAVAKNDARQLDQRIHVYQEGREERRVRQLAILGDLRRAARNDEFKLFLQPKILLKDNSVCGAEALVRWDHPTFGWLPPGEFIPVAEQSGNISHVTHWALTAAVRECRLWLEEGLRIPVSVNLSGRDLANPDLPVFILELLRNHDLDPSFLMLELTEQALVRDATRASLVLQCLRDLGIRISIDDFGTGYSSLAQIRNLPVDELKIDRSFVMGLPGSREDAAIVRAAVDLAHDLGLEVVAEGVESAATLRWLTELGCERAQGFHMSRPMPADAFVGWVNRYADSHTVEMPSPLLGSVAIRY